MGCRRRRAWGNWPWPRSGSQPCASWRPVGWTMSSGGRRAALQTNAQRQATGILRDERSEPSRASWCRKGERRRCHSSCGKGDAWRKSMLRRGWIDAAGHCTPRGTGLDATTCSGRWAMIGWPKPERRPADGEPVDGEAADGELFVGRPTTSCTPRQRVDGLFGLGQRESRARRDSFRYFVEVNLRVET